jgi:hypothetical protein
MKRSYLSPNLFWPFLLISLGGLLLLQVLGLLPVGLWEVLIRLWPLLLIALGLDMLIGHRSRGRALLVLFLSSLLLIAALLLAALRANLAPAGQTQPIIQSTHGVERAEVTIDFKSGELNLSALGGSVYLMEGQLTHGPLESLQQRYLVKEGVGRLNLLQQQDLLIIPFVKESAQWDVHLTPDLPLTLDVRANRDNMNLDLSGLPHLTDLNLRTGEGAARVIFSVEASLRASLKTGDGAVTLTIPTDLPTRLTVNSDSTRLFAPPRFSRVGRVYTTQNFSTAGPYLDLEVEGEGGEVNVQ